MLEPAYAEEPLPVSSVTRGQGDTDQAVTDQKASEQPMVGGEWNTLNDRLLKLERSDISQIAKQHPAGVELEGLHRELKIRNRNEWRDVKLLISPGSLMQLAGDEEPAIRASALKVLSRPPYVESEKTVDIFQNTLSADIKELRTIAATSLTLIGSPRALALLKAHVKVEPDPALRADISQYLAKVLPAPSRPVPKKQSKSQAPSKKKKPSNQKKKGRSAS